jgi:hypothetical protein
MWKCANLKMGRMVAGYKVQVAGYKLQEAP